MKYQTFGASIRQQEEELRQALLHTVRTLNDMSKEEKKALENHYGMPINPNPKPREPLRKRFIERAVRAGTGSQKNKQAK